MTSTSSTPAPRRPAPFLKWAGGKRRLLPAILARLPPGPIAGRYLEPFVGGGAVFFELAATGRVARATLVDTNEELARTYVAVQKDPAGLVAELRDPSRGYVYDEKAYYAIRALDPQKLTLVRAAARTIYLNHCGFNGLYRVNKAGGFNVPFGRYTNPTICDEEGILAASRALRCARLRLADFDVAMEEAKSGDVAYCDSPYIPASATSNFTSYTQDGFSLGDQERLRDMARTISRRGVFVLLSNSDTPTTRKLYAGKDFQFDEVSVARRINSDPSKRGNVGELLIRCVAH